MNTYLVSNRLDQPIVTTLKDGTTLFLQPKSSPEGSKVTLDDTQMTSYLLGLKHISVITQKEEKTKTNKGGKQDGNV